MLLRQAVLIDAVLLPFRCIHAQPDGIHFFDAAEVLSGKLCFFLRGDQAATIVYTARNQRIFCRNVLLRFDVDNQRNMFSSARDYRAEQHIEGNHAFCLTAGFVVRPTNILCQYRTSGISLVRIDGNNCHFWRPFDALFRNVLDGRVGKLWHEIFQNPREYNLLCKQPFGSSVIRPTVLVEHDAVKDIFIYWHIVPSLMICHTIFYRKW